MNTKGKKEKDERNNKKKLEKNKRRKLKRNIKKNNTIIKRRLKLFCFHVQLI